MPGVWVGAQLSAHAPGGLVRRALAFVLLASALKLLNVSTPHTGIVLLLVLLIAPVVWMLVRRRHGFPASPRAQGRGSGDPPCGSLVEGCALPRGWGISGDRGGWPRLHIPTPGDAMPHPISAALAFAAALLCAPVPVEAPSGTIEGTVRDRSGVPDRQCSGPGRRSPP